MYPYTNVYPYICISNMYVSSLNVVSYENQNVKVSISDD